jgi:hypothetical protein
MPAVFIPFVVPVCGMRVELEARLDITAQHARKRDRELTAITLSGKYAAFFKLGQGCLVRRENWRVLVFLSVFSGPYKEQADQAHSKEGRGRNTPCPPGPGMGNGQNILDIMELSPGPGIADLAGGNTAEERWPAYLVCHRARLLPRALKKRASGAI